MLSMDKKSHGVRYVITPWFLNAPKSCVFKETLKIDLINSTPQIKLSQAGD